MDVTLKVFQIGFYTVGSIIAILTFIKAKNGLLNSVNTEYQKKVMERLAEISDELWEEFDYSSENHWSKNDDLKQALETIHVYAKENKHELLTEKTSFPGVPLPKKQLEIMALKEKLKSDPFVPNRIRGKLISILDNRVASMFEAYHSVIGTYQEDLAKGKHWNSLDDNHGWISNKIVGVMARNGAGITDLENAAHEIRLEIQKYYDEFNPIKTNKQRQSDS